MKPAGGSAPDPALEATAFAAEVDRGNLERLQRVCGWFALICLAQLALNYSLPQLRVGSLGGMEVLAAAVYAAIGWWLRRRKVRSAAVPVGLVALTSEAFSITICLTVLERMGPNVAFAVATLGLALFLLWRGPLLPVIVLVAHGLCVALILRGPFPVKFQQVSIIGNTFAVLFAFIAAWLLLRARRAEFDALRLISRQNETLATLNREKDELMAVVAHDLRGPLGSVAQLAGMIPKHEPGLSPPTQAALGEILRAATQMRTLAAELVEAHEVETSMDSPGEVQLGDLAGAVRQAVALYAPQAETKHQQLTFSDDASPAVMVPANPRVLARILGNLISNALKYTPAGGQIEVRLKMDAGTASLIVSDSGPGISPAEAARLFHKFARLSHRPTAGEPSTGLGLYATRKLMEQISGRLIFEGCPAQGAKFVASFPLASGNA